MFDERKPTEALNFAKVILRELANAVEASQGTFDKFTGDGFLVYFDKNSGKWSHADLACQASILRILSRILMHSNNLYFI